MATVKKVRKAQTGDRFGITPFKGVCGKDAECLARREERKQNREEKRAFGETLGQRILKGIGLSTQEGIERRQARREDRSARREERKENRQYRREERRANRGGGGGDAPGAWKNGGKMAKSKAIKKATKPTMKKGGAIKKTMVKTSKKK
jgi:hypothetical protein